MSNEDKVESESIKDRFVFAVDAEYIHKELLPFPNLHILFYRNDFGVMVAKSTDFGLYGHSELKNDQEAMEEAFNIVTHLAQHHIISYYEGGKIDQLFERGSKIIGDLDWILYNETMRNGKIRAIKEAFESVNYRSLKNYINTTLENIEITDGTVKRLLDTLDDVILGNKLVPVLDLVED